MAVQWRKTTRARLMLLYPSWAAEAEMNTSLPHTESSACIGWVSVWSHWDQLAIRKFNWLQQNLGKDRCCRAGCIPTAWLSPCNFLLVFFTSLKAQLTNSALLAASRTRNALTFPSATASFYLSLYPENWVYFSKFYFFSQVNRTGTQHFISARL